MNCTARNASRLGYCAGKVRPSQSRPGQVDSIRTFSSSRRLYEQRSKQSFRSAWNNTRVQWGRPVPIGLTIAALGGLQFYRVSAREKARQEDEQLAEDGTPETDNEGRPKKRPRIRPSGPWYDTRLRKDECLSNTA